MEVESEQVMSATKRDSIDGCGTSEDEFWAGYEEWSDSLGPTNDQDIDEMAAEEEIHAQEYAA